MDYSNLDKPDISGELIEMRMNAMVELLSGFVSTLHVDRDTK